MRPIHTPAVVLWRVAILATLALGACATRGPAMMHVAVVGRGADAALVAELQERLVAELVEVPRVDPIGAIGAIGEPDPFIIALGATRDDAAARTLAARRALTHVLIAEVSESAEGLRADLRAVAVDSGAVVWRASWRDANGGLGAVVGPWVRALLTTTGYGQQLPPVAMDLALRPAADETWDGYEALGEGDMVSAHDAFDAALARAPNRVRTLHGIALVEVQEDALDEALAHAERALAQRPNASLTQRFAASVALRVGHGRVREARDLAAEADDLAHDAEDPDREVARRLAALSWERRAAAHDAFRRAIALDLGPRPAVAWRAALALAGLQTDADPAAAIATLSAALDRLAASPCALPASPDERVACDDSAVAEARAVNYQLIDRLTALSPSPAPTPALLDDLPTDVAALGARLAADPELVRARDCAGVSLLHLAAAAGDVARIDLLLAAGAAVDPLDDHRWTPLDRAARAGNGAALDRLLIAGADLAMRDANGRTPLHIASMFGQVGIVRRMIKARVPLAAMNRDGETALHLAARVGDVDVIRALLAAGAVIDAPAWRDRSPLTLAALRDQGAAVRVLAAAGADPGRVDSTGQPVLIGAAEADAIGALRALVAVGADVNVRLYYGGTALHRVARRGAAPTIRALLELGADPNLVDGSDAAPLHEAAGHANVDTVTALLAGGAALDLRDGGGRTALSIAAARGDATIVTALLAAGADRGVADVKGRIPFEYAVMGSHVEVLQLLAPLRTEAPPLNEEKDLGREGGGRMLPIILAARAGASAATFDALFAAGWTVDERTADGVTALMIAAASNRDSLVEHLLARGADPLRRDASGRTAAHRAARAGALDALEILLRRAPTLVTATDERGLTAIHHAAAGGSEEALEALIAAGADLAALTRSGACSPPGRALILRAAPNPSAGHIGSSPGADHGVA